MKTRKVNEITASLGIALLLSVSAAFLGITLGKHLPFMNALPLLFFPVGGFILICTVSRPAAKAFLHRHGGTPLRERRALMRQHLEDCKADPTAALSRYRFILVAPILCLFLYFLLALSIVIAGGLCFPLSPGGHEVVGPLITLTCGIVGWLLLYMPLYRLFGRITPKLTPASNTPLPRLEAIIQQAFDTVGIRGKYRIRQNRRYLTRITPYGKTYVLSFSPYMLSVLTEEELYQLLLMQLDHFSRPAAYRFYTTAWDLIQIGSSHIRWETFALDLFYSYTHATLEWKYEFCYVAYQCQRSRKGLERILKDGDPSAAVTGWGKIFMWQYFSFEYTQHLPEPYYLAPDLHDHHEKDVCDAFRNALQSRQEEWAAMLSRRLLTVRERYTPLFRDYMEVLSPHKPVPPLPLDPPDPTTAFGRDILTLLAKFEKHEYDKNLVDYKEKRRYAYQDPLRFTESYEAAPESYTTVQLIPVIDAYCDLLRFDKAEEVCDSILNTATNPFDKAHALYVKGECLLRRYDNEGLRLICHAMDLNPKYREEGEALVDEYCTLCGLEEEYAAFLDRTDN